MVLIRRSYSPALLLGLLLLAGCGVSSDLDRADRLAAERRWTEAVETYKAVLAEYRNSYRAAWGIARIYCLERRMFDQCLEWTGPLLEAYPEDARYRRARAAGLRERARYLRERGDSDAAAADDAAATQLDPR